MKIIRISLFISLVLYAVNLSALQKEDNQPNSGSEVDLSPIESDFNHISYFLLEVNNTLSFDVSVDYATRNDSATAGEDYIFTSGTATIPAGETSTIIGIEVIGDVNAEDDENFILSLTNPQGASFPNNQTELTASKTIVDDDKNTQVINYTSFENGNDEENYTSDSWGTDGFSKIAWDKFDLGRTHIDTSESHTGDASLRVKFPQGGFSTDESGAQIQLQFIGENEVYISYWFKFSDNFDWGGTSEGGKLPGAAISNNLNDLCSGGEICDGTNGSSARLMWRENGRAVLYLYHMDKPGDYGEDFNLLDANENNIYFEKDTWYHLLQRVKINSDNDNNGEVQVWINGIDSFKKLDVRFVNDGSIVNNLFFSTFHGGSDSSWAPEVDCYIWFDDILIYTKK